MNGQPEMSKCKHALEPGEIWIGESKTALSCSFCEIENLRAENARATAAAQTIHDLATARINNPPLDANVEHDLREIQRLTSELIRLPWGEEDQRLAGGR